MTNTLMTNKTIQYKPSNK